MTPLRFPRYVVTFGASLAILAALTFSGLLVITAPAAAEVPYQDFKTGVCPNALCLVNFAPPPAGKRLAVTSESCSFTIQANAQIVEAEMDLVDTGNNVVLREFLVPSLVSNVAVIGKTYATNHTTLIYVPPTYHLRGRLSVNASNGETIVCKITGTVETP